MSAISYSSLHLLLAIPLSGYCVTAPLFMDGLSVSFTADVTENLTQLPSSNVDSMCLEDTLTYPGVTISTMFFSSS